MKLGMLMLREGFEVVHTDQSSDSVLRNLFEFYLHDLAEWFKFDQLPDGRYTQSTDPYWQNGHDVYLLYAAEIPVGFALLGPAETSVDTKDMHEFFVVRRHRREGIGQEFAEHTWRLHPGPWLVRVYSANEPAVPFWRKAISEFTGGDYLEEIHRRGEHPWSYFSFESQGGH
jgi:predicted acetyltransferase